MSKEVSWEPRVTIVVPVYNGEKYVAEALRSAVNQTYKNLEILVVDDGSSDGTEAIVKSFGNKVRYIKKENGGVSSALNLALDKMTGEYFSWLSHDDTYEKNKIEREVQFLRENNYFDKDVIVFSDYYLIDKKGKLISESRKDHAEIVAKPEYILLKGHINGLSLLIPKKAFDEFGKFDTEKVCTQDYLMWQKMMRKYKFVHIPECLVSTRWHAEQVTNSDPRVEIEGNEFYINAMKEVSKKRMEELEGSEYCFMSELADFYKNSVYTGAEKFCRNRMKELFDEAKETAIDKKVSVVIPFYNRAKELERAVESVFKQTHQNLEIILVDDGSDDDRSKIEKMVKKHSDVKLVRNNERKGVSFSRNLGMSKAEGDYVAFLDSDDEFLPEKIEKQLQYMVAAKAKISHTSYWRDRDGERVVTHSGEDHGHAGRKFIYNCGVAVPTVMVERRWFKEGKFEFNEKIEIGEDTCLWLTILKRGAYLIGVDEPLSIVHVGSEAAAYTDEKQMVGLKEIIRFILNDDYYVQFDAEIAQLMRGYTQVVGRVFPERDPLVSGGALYKFVFFARQEGLGSVMKRVGKKMKKVLKG